MAVDEITGYGKVALLAVDMARDGTEPAEAWQTAAGRVYPEAPASRVKGCPRGAFLGLAEAGLIRGVAPGEYTRSRDNKRYAIEALAALEADPSLSASPRALWRSVMAGNAKQHNGQMDVVLALWKHGGTVSME